MFELYKQPDDLWCDSHSIFDEITLQDQQFTFKECTRLIPNWKYNTWKAFEPSFEQSVSWNELTALGDTWKDLEEIRQDNTPSIPNVLWNQIRSIDITEYSQAYTELQILYPMFNWPSFLPDDSKDSDKEYWNCYDKISKIGMYQKIGGIDTVRPLDLFRRRITEEGEEKLFEENQNQINEGRETVLDEFEILVIDNGNIVPPSEWSQSPKTLRIWEDRTVKLTEDGNRFRLEDGNLL